MPYTISRDVCQGHEILVLSGGGQEMRVAPGLGANWFSWRACGAELFAPFDLSWKGTKYGVPVLFPTPNRVREGRYRWRGRTHTQMKKGELRVIHGLVYDEPFEAAAVAERPDSCEAELEVRIRDGELLSSYPFPCGLRLIYRLDAEGPRLTYRVTNLGREEMPFGFAVHPYFAKMDPPERTYIRVPAPYVHEAGDDRIPSGRVLPVAGTYFDLREFRSTADAVLDHVYSGMTGDMGADLEWRRSGIAVRLTASADFDHMVVFTPADRPCVCLENQTCSTDAHNRHADGFADTAHLIVLAPGGTHEGWIRFAARRIGGDAG